jgi:hypothetical protein
MKRLLQHRGIDRLNNLLAGAANTPFARFAIGHHRNNAELNLKSQNSDYLPRLILRRGNDWMDRSSYSIKPNLLTKNSPALEVLMSKIDVATDLVVLLLPLKMHVLDEIDLPIHK